LSALGEPVADVVGRVGDGGDHPAPVHGERVVLEPRAQPGPAGDDPPAEGDHQCGHPQLEGEPVPQGQVRVRLGARQRGRNGAADRGVQDSDDQGQRHADQDRQRRGEQQAR
jgi:hypothetical protein